MTHEMFFKNRKDMLIALMCNFFFFFCRQCFERPPRGSDFYALPLPWGALQWRAYACPAWRVMSIAPAGSSSNSVHIKSGQATDPQLEEELGARKGGGTYWARAIRFYFSVSLFLALPNDLSISVFSQVFFFFLFPCHLLNRAKS